MPFQMALIFVTISELFGESISNIVTLMTCTQGVENFPKKRHEMSLHGPVEVISI